MSVLGLIDYCLNSLSSSTYGKWLRCLLGALNGAAVSYFHGFTPQSIVAGVIIALIHVWVVRFDNNWIDTYRLHVLSGVTTLARTKTLILPLGVTLVAFILAPTVSFWLIGAVVLVGSQFVWELYKDATNYRLIQHDMNTLEKVFIKYRTEQPNGILVTPPAHKLSPPIPLHNPETNQRIYFEKPPGVSVGEEAWDGAQSAPNDAIILDILSKDSLRISKQHVLSPWSPEVRDSLIRMATYGWVDSDYKPTEVGKQVVEAIRYLYSEPMPFPLTKTRDLLIDHVLKSEMTDVQIDYTNNQ